MTSKRLSLRSRIFLYMILLVVVASILIAAVTLFQYNEQSKDYHKQRLERKERQILSSMDYVLEETTYERTPERLGLIFKDKIYEISNNLNVDFNLYDLQGTLVKSSVPDIEHDSISRRLSPEILNQLNFSVNKRFVEKNEALGGNFQSSYIIFSDYNAKPLGILQKP